MAKTSKTIPKKGISSASQPTTKVEETTPNVVVLDRSTPGAATDEPMV